MTEPAELMATIRTIASSRGTYAPDAYFFVLQALESILESMGERRHLSGGELLEGIRDLAKERFGLMAKDVLNDWGVFSTLDFGHVVFHLVEAGLLAKTPEDSLSDFIDIYDFARVFEVDYFKNQTH